MANLGRGELHTLSESTVKGRTFTSLSFSCDMSNWNNRQTLSNTGSSNLLCIMYKFKHCVDTVTRFVVQC